MRPSEAVMAWRKYVAQQQAKGITVFGRPVNLAKWGRDRG